ncbi:tRNA (34-2'-O)-methyltransferase regulator [Trichinella pseudospiralis]
MVDGKTTRLSVDFDTDRRCDFNQAVVIIKLLTLTKPTALNIENKVFSGLTATEWAFRETSVGLIVLSGPLPDDCAKVEPLLTACCSPLQGLF